mmetsp:Transcript_31694/g.83758  ORF Transcript_31694/g.83758 Transcript_31694/m.83758 type:complete len:386 (-) Transcript_31694:440-1597(-)
MQRQEDYQESRSQGMRRRMPQACVDQAAPRLPTRTLLRDQVVHDAGRYYELSLIEAEILRDVNAKGGRGRSHCVVLLNFFKFQGHACMVFETLGMSLYDFLKSNDYIPFPLYCVQSFARQMLEAVQFLHEMSLVHTDLKPENVLLCDTQFRTQQVHGLRWDRLGGRCFCQPIYRRRSVRAARDRPHARPREASPLLAVLPAPHLLLQVGKKLVKIPTSSKIKLIDFGCATYDNDEHKSTLIATRQYRAPEVILGLPWSYASDIWSVGCIVAELYCGDQYFETHSNMEHIALIERGIDRWPRHMVEASEYRAKYFDAHGLSLWRTALDADGRRHVRAMKNIEDFVGKDYDTGLLSFFRALLTIDPEKRITAPQALRKSFVRQDSGS